MFRSTLDEERFPSRAKFGSGQSSRHLCNLGRSLTHKFSLQTNLYLLLNIKWIMIKIACPWRIQMLLISECNIRCNNWAVDPLTWYHQAAIHSFQTFQQEPAFEQEPGQSTSSLSSRKSKRNRQEVSSDDAVKRSSTPGTTHTYK